MSAIVDHLRGHGERVAVLTDTAQLTYRELADRVVEAAQAIGGTRALVLLETRNDLRRWCTTWVRSPAITWCCPYLPDVTTRRWCRPTSPTS